ncbi:MAG: FtsX-like permease family protein [bacterium]
MINIVGLTLGILCWIFLLLWIDYEDDSRGYSENKDKLYRIGRFDNESSELIIRKGKSENRIQFPETPLALARYLVKTFPNISHAVRFGYDGMKKVKYQDSIFEEIRFGFADEEFLRIFNFKYKEGNIKTALSGENGVIITQSTATRYFGQEKALDKILSIDNVEQLVVKAVIKDIPEYYRFQFDFLANMSLIDNKYPEDWKLDRVNTYFLAKKDVSIPLLEEQINSTLKNRNCGILRIWRLPQLSVYDNLISYSDRKEDDKMFEFLSLAVIFILLTACINYSNLSTAISSKRAVEVGIRKVLGASQWQLITQFLCEAVFLSLISLFLSLVLTWIFLPVFNELTGYELKLNLTINFMLKLLNIGIFSGILAGIYPALFMSGFIPIKILKGDFRSGPKGEIFRKILVVFQFSFSITLIISSLLVFEQFELTDKKKIAYDAEYYVSIPFKSDKNFNKFKKEILVDEEIVDAVLLNDEKGQNSGNNNNRKRAIITIKPMSLKESLKFIEEKWKKYNANVEFEYSFFNEGFSEIFEKNELKANLLFFFTFVIIIISYIGLFGYAAFMVKQKTSEIALRKAFGATFKDIFLLMSGEYVKLVFVANLIAFFYVVYPLNTWFTRFSHRINISYKYFLYTLIITVVLTIFTLAYHSIKASLTNPAVNLRSE